MNRISRTFRKLAAVRKKGFIAYIMAGVPDLQRTRQVISILEECGADIIELGVPFSDPLADGPTIQKAAQRALESGVTLDTVIEFVRSLRDSTQIPIILMTYYNLIYKYGEERFVREAHAAGIDGIIIPDLPPDEADLMMNTARKTGFDIIFLLAPTSTEERVKKVSRASRGFIYYVSITGITGSALSLDPATEAHITFIKKMSRKPVAIGFGISTPQEAAEVAGISDAVIVGSAIVKRLEQPDDELRSYLTSLREAIDRGQA